MSPRRLLQSCLVLAALGVTAPVHHAAAGETRPQAHARRTTEPIVIDGILGEAAWGTAPVQDGFVQQVPDEGADATERTEFRVLYDDTTVYVGVRLYDTEPDAVAAYLSRRDTWTPSDWLTLGLGTHHDGRSAFEFSVNPSGVKRDGRWTNDTAFDQNWDGVWRAASTRDALGWTAELAVPLSQLRFDPADGDAVAWDLQVSRYIARKNETARWAPSPRDDAGYVSHFGEVVGLEGLAPAHQLEALPYLMGGVGVHDAEPGNPFRTGNDLLWNLGGDLTFGLTGDLTLAATVNPDFGQIEADPAQINLSAFESYFDERRPFFLEGASSFAIDGPTFFYSRRIGRAPQRFIDAGPGYAHVPAQTTILGAARLTGKTGPWTVGVLDAVTAPEYARVVDESGVNRKELAEPLANAFVARLRRDLRGGDSVVGGIVTGTHRDMKGYDDLRSQAYSGAVDFEHRWADRDWKLLGFAGFSHVRGSAQAILDTQQSSARYFQRPDAQHLSVDPNRASLSGFTGALRVARVSGAIVGEAGFDTATPGFEINDLGYQTRVDYLAGDASVRYRDMDPGPLVRYWDVRLRGNSSWSYGLEHTGWWLGSDANLQFSNYWGAWAGGGISPGGLCTRCTRGGPAMVTGQSIDTWAGLYSDSRDLVSGSLSGWYWRELWTGSDSWGISPWLTFRPARWLDVSVGTSLDVERDDWEWVGDYGGHYLFADIVRYDVSATLRLDMALTPDLTVQAYARPFLGSGRYTDFIELVQPRADGYRRQFDARATLHRADGELELGSIGALDGDPDYHYEQLDTNVVLRWEYLPGSTFFAVWQVRASSSGGDGEFHLGRGLEDLFGGHADVEHLVMAKLSLWWSS